MMREKLGMYGRLGMLVVVGAMLIGADALTASARTRISQGLSPTAKVPGAKGQAKLQLKTGNRGKFSVKGKHLPAGKTFAVLVKKIKVGTLTTNASGSGVARFSTAANGQGKNQVLGCDPQGEEVEVRDDDGDDVLEGEMPDENPDSAVGCCLTEDSHRSHDDGEVECENMTVEACTAHGGTPTGAAGCLPDPCGGTPPPVDVVCCRSHSESGGGVDDDPEVECEDSEHEGECAEHGGTLVQGPSCDVCQAVPPATVVVCCVPDDNEFECERITPEHCAARGGTENAATSCSDHPCGGGDGGHDGGGDHSGHGGSGGGDGSDG